MMTDENRVWNFLPTVKVNLDVKKACKRFVYYLDYLLLTFAYKTAFSTAYLQAPETSGRHELTQMRLVLHVENIARPRASC